jgi:hypothetical protein
MATKRIKVYEVRRMDGAKHETIWHYADIKNALSRIHGDDGERDRELFIYEITLEWGPDDRLDAETACGLINRRDYAFNVVKVI